MLPGPPLTGHSTSGLEPVRPASAAARSAQASGARMAPDCSRLSRTGCGLARRALLRLEHHDVGIGTDHLGVLAADLAVLLGLLVKVTHRVAAQQREAVARRKLVPQDLEANGRLGAAVLPQDVHHFAVRAD